MTQPTKKATHATIFTCPQMLLFVCQVLLEGGESWRCGEDKRHQGGGGGICDYDCCVHCMDKQGVSIVSYETLSSTKRHFKMLCERCLQQKRLFHFWRPYNRQAVKINSNPNVKKQASLPVEGWTKKYSGVGENRST